jgi:hypothetical protein
VPQVWTAATRRGRASGVCHWYLTFPGSAGASTWVSPGALFVPGGV